VLAETEFTGACSRFIGVGAIKIGFTPSFRDDARAVRTALVSGSQFAGHGKLTRTRGENQGNDLF
jgi:hypothetical protein